jgi:hypothetical protein
MKTTHACVRGLVPFRFGIRIKKRGTPGIHEECFMIFSWTHHVRELEYQQNYKTRRRFLKVRAYHAESTTESWIVKRRPKYICHSTSSGDRAVCCDVLHVLRGAARDRLDCHTAWGKLRT